MSTAVQAQYRTAQDKLTRQAVAPVLAILNDPAVGYPKTDAQWARLVALATPPTEFGRRSSRNLARELYATQAPDGRGPDLPDREYSFDVLAAGLERVGVREKLVDPSTHMQGVVQGASVVSRHVEMAGRDYMRQASYTDEKSVGWARVARGPRTCAFCLMLISRGPVYHSASTAGLNDDGTMNQWHIRCDCQAVPVFDPDDWIGRDQYLQAQQAWIDATDEYDGQAKLNAFRSAVENRSPLGSKQRSRSEAEASRTRDGDDPGPAPVATVAKADDSGKAPRDVTDDEMDAALQAAIAAEDWDRFEALSEESDRRDEERAAALQRELDEAEAEQSRLDEEAERQAEEDARRASESAARSERRRAQRSREQEERLDLMVEMIDQGASEEEAYAEAYGSAAADRYRRQRAVEVLRQDGYQGRSFDKVARRAYRDHVEQEYMNAEDECRGALLTPRSERAGVDPRRLFSGPVDYAKKHASEELLEYWENNGRLTFAEFVANLLGFTSQAATIRRSNGVSRDR